MKKAKNLKIAIIGWKKSWGNFCFRHLSKHGGHKLLLRDKGSRLSLKYIAKKADIIIVAVPLPVMVKTIKQLGVLRSNQLIIDFASRKVATMEAMLKTGAQVLGLHPLAAAPLEKSKALGCTVVACVGKVTSRQYESWIRRFLKKSKAKVVWRSPEEHDIAILVQQNLIFEALLVHAITVQKLGIPTRDVLELRTKLSRKPLAAMARMLLNNSPIYADILQGKGRERARARHVFESASVEVRDLIEGSKEQLLERMSALRRYFGDEMLKKLVEGEF